MFLLFWVGPFPCLQIKRSLELQQQVYMQTAILLVPLHRVPPPKESMKGVLRESLLVGKHSGSSQLRHSSWVTARAIVVVSSRPDSGQRQTFVGQQRYSRCAVMDSRLTTDSDIKGRSPWLVGDWTTDTPM